jgi:hypothetical protein
MVTIDEVMARLIAEGVAVSVHPDGVGAAGPLILHLDPNRRLAAELATEAPGRVRQVVSTLDVVGRYREVGDWLLAHPDPAVAERLFVMVPQVAEITGPRRAAGRPPRPAGPILRHRPGPVAPGCCASCGEPLPASTVPAGPAGIRCRACRTAAQVALVRVLEGVPGYARVVSPLAPPEDSGRTAEGAG